MHSFALGYFSCCFLGLGDILSDLSLLSGDAVVDKKIVPAYDGFAYPLNFKVVDFEYDC